MSKDHDYNVRKPTEIEYVQLAKCLMLDDEERQVLKQVVKPLTTEHVAEYIKDYYTAVIDKYVSDAQGYAGKVFTIVWGDVFFCTRIIEDKETGKLTVLRK